VLALEVPLVYQQYSGDEKTFHPYGFATLKFTSSPPPGTWKLPSFVSSRPAYALVRFAEQDRLVVLDQQKAKDNFYNRLYFDSNANRDLTDDPVVGTKIDQDDYSMSATFPVTDTTVLVDNTEMPYRFTVSASYFKGDDQPKGRFDWTRLFGSVSAQCAYRGEFDLDGKQYRVWLGDTNANARFDDKASANSVEQRAQTRRIDASGDQFYLTTEREVFAWDRQVLSDQLLVGGQLLDLHISPTQNVLTLTPFAGELAPLTLPYAPERLSIYTQDEKHFMAIYRPSDTLMIPPGSYRLLAYEVLRNDDQGDGWTLSAAATPDCTPVTVQKAAEPALAFGEPYNLLAQVEKSPPQENSGAVRLAFTARGTGMEVVTDLARVSGNKTRIAMSPKSKQRPKEPTYKIVDPSGELVAQGQFEYG
jgi:hypothetical protein